MKTETKIVIALIIIVAYGIFSMAGVMAYGSTRANACRNYHIFAHQDTGREEVDSDFCGEAAPSKPNKQNADTSTESPAVTSTSTPVVTQDTPSVETPVIVETPEVETPEETGRVHCNNGNGNGAEGCNASDRGNQDETPEKGDKDVNHPSHN